MSLIYIKVDVELHPHGIVPIFKKCIKSFCIHKFKIFLKFFFLYLIYSLGRYNRNKTRPRRPLFQFKESGCNSVLVQYQVNHLLLSLIWFIEFGKTNWISILFWNIYLLINHIMIKYPNISFYWLKPGRLVEAIYFVTLV